VTLIKSDRIFI